jgi:hypothetical protein
MGCEVSLVATTAATVRVWVCGQAYCETVDNELIELGEPSLVHLLNYLLSEGGQLDRV